MKKILMGIMLLGLSVQSLMASEKVAPRPSLSTQSQPNVNKNASRVDGHFTRFVGESFNKKILVDKVERKYIEYSTTKESKFNNQDLIIVLHGGNGNAERMKNKTIFTDLAKGNNLVLVYPEAEDRFWKDGREGIDSNEDILFIEELIKDYKKKGINKVLVTGFSNGGILSLRLACEDIKGLTHVAAIAGSLPTNYQCKSSFGKHVMMINGVDDELIRWEGGIVPKFGNINGIGSVMPIEYTVNIFKNNGKCFILNRKEIDVNFSDRSSVEKQTFKCEKGSLEFFRIEGGGHTIPGGRERATLSNNIGNTNRDISAEGEIINFLKNK